jgi:helicase MOV-10
MRVLRAIVGSPQDHNLLRASAPYVSPYRGKRAPVGEIVPGDRPPRLARHPYVRKLGKCLIPPDLIKALSVGSREVADVISRIPVALKPSSFNRKTYTITIKTRLWVEEYQAEYVLLLENFAISAIDHYLPQAAI